MVDLTPSSWRGESGPTIGTVDRAPLVGVVDLPLPVGVVDLASPVGGCAKRTGLLQFWSLWIVLDHLQSRMAKINNE